MLYAKNYSTYIHQLLSNDKKRPFIFSQLLYHLKNNNPEYLLDFIGEEDYGLVFYITFIECCLDKIILPQNELLEESIIVLLKKLLIFLLIKILDYIHLDTSNFLEFSCGFVNLIFKWIEDLQLLK